MHVFCPSDATEAVEVLREAHSINGPCYIRLAKGNEPLMHEMELSRDVLRAEELYCGEHIALLSTGSVLKEAVDAAEYFLKKGIRVGVYNFATIKPIDEEAICRVAREYDTLISIEEHNIVGGFGGAIAEVIASMSGKRARLIRIGLQDEYTTVVGSQSYLRKKYKIDADAIKKVIEQILSKTWLQNKGE